MFLRFNLRWRLGDHTKCSLLFPQDTKSDSKNAKKKNNKKTSKNKSSLSRANKKKPGMPNVSNDLSQKLYATMEKHKEVLQNTMMHDVLGTNFIALKTGKYSKLVWVMRSFVKMLQNFL